MKKYEVLVSLDFAGYVYVEAETEAEAQDKVADMLDAGEILPTDQFEPDTEIIVIGEE
jgi:hypothetical protein